MTTEEMFKYGVVPKNGKHAGERYEVMSITKDGVCAVRYDSGLDEEAVTIPHGQYDLWSPPKTIFEQSSPTTWGKLKKAMSQNDLADETRFYIVDAFGGIQVAYAKLGKVNGDQAVILY